MQQQKRRASRLRPWTVALFGATALCAVIEVLGAASLPAMHGADDQLRHGAKDETRFDNGPLAGFAAHGQSEQTDLLQTVQFMPRLDGPPVPAQGRMGPPPFPGPGFPDGMPPKFPPRKICLEDVSRQMAIYAYLKGQLQLTDDHKGAAKPLDDAMESSAGKLRALCQSLPAEVSAPSGISERADVMEKQLATRLDLLHALKGPMQDLRAKLSPDQRAALDLPPPPFPPFPPL